MITKALYPILEFDPNKDSKINPYRLVGDKVHTNKLIITFFPEVMDKLLNNNELKEVLVIPGENPVFVYKFVDDEDICITLGQVGCPACAGNLDILSAYGFTKVMFCGGGGVLDKNIAVGQLLLVDGAIRDEGFSYHYLEPSRYVYNKPEVNDKIAKYLDSHHVSYMRGIVWTTDALFRETEERIKQRKEEGAKIVEMEQAGCLAVAKFRDFDYGALIYGGDDCDSVEWSNRDWRSREGIRYDLVMLCKDVVKEI